jgi:hypothetical protein
MQKYRNRITTVDGIKFHSKKEAERYCDLKILERKGVIKFLTLQPKFDIVVNGIKICTYIADFSYRATNAGGKEVRVVEDVKGVKTSTYRLKKKLMKAVWKIEILET